MPDSTLFDGIAVVIDDQILDEKSGIWTIETQIKDQGCHVIAMQDLPDAAQLRNLRSVSFFVVDWNLTATPIGDELGAGTSLIPKGLWKANAARIVEFLEELKKIRFAPVFIFTDQSVETVINYLKKHNDLYDESGPSHIFVKSKAEVIDSGVFNVLSDHLKSAPSAYVLKTWEREYERAKNALFLDFYNKSVYWPLLLWKTFEDDHVPPSIELGNLIGRNLLSRMTPFEFDLGAFQDSLALLTKDKDNYRKLLLQVLEGERFLPKDQLHATSVAPGDVFKVKDHYFINVRPDCDCIGRDSNEQDAVDLYLLEGSKLTKGQVERAYIAEYGVLRETDSLCIIFAMKDGVTVSFAFKTLTIGTWGEWKEKRIGRLLPPFLTRLQQRYSDYLRRPGLTRIPEQAVDLSMKEVGSADSSVSQDNIGPTQAPAESSVAEGAARDEGRELEATEETPSERSEASREEDREPEANEETPSERDEAARDEDHEGGNNEEARREGDNSSDGTGGDG
jgi:hypothetical protein